MGEEIGDPHELQNEELTIPTHAEHQLDTSELNDDNKRTHDQVEIIEGEDEEASEKRLKVRAGSVAAAKKVNSDQWDAMFERLKAYKAEHGVRKTMWSFTLQSFREKMTLTIISPSLL